MGLQQQRNDNMRPNINSLQKVRQGSKNDIIAKVKCMVGVFKKCIFELQSKIKSKKERQQLAEMKQRNVVIKPIKLEHSNKNMTTNKKPQQDAQEFQEDFLEMIDSKIMKQDQIKKEAKNEINYDDDDDCSSVSSVDSDIGIYNIWDNSELRLRGINEDFQDFYGKKLSFLQLFKLRSSFFEKAHRPTFKNIFQGAERVYRFCRSQLSLDEFLKDENIERSVVSLNFQSDTNYNRFNQYYQNTIQSNVIKNRSKKYNRYFPSTNNLLQAGKVNENDNLDENATSQMESRETNNTILNGLNLSPRKAPKKSSDTSRKSQMNLQQLNQMHKKQKQQLTQQFQQQPRLSQEENSKPTSYTDIADQNPVQNSTAESFTKNTPSNSGSPKNVKQLMTTSYSPLFSSKQSSPQSNYSGSVSNNPPGEFRLRLQSTQNFQSAGETSPQSNEKEKESQMQPSLPLPSQNSKKQLLVGSDWSPHRKMYHEQKVVVASPSLFTQFIEKTQAVPEMQQQIAEFNSTSKSSFGLTKLRISPSKSNLPKLPEIEPHKSITQGFGSQQFNKQQSEKQFFTASNSNNSERILAPKYSNGDLLRSSKTFSLHEQNIRSSRGFQNSNDLYNAPSSLLPLQKQLPQQQQLQQQQQQQEKGLKPKPKILHKKHLSYNITPEDIQKIQNTLHIKY